MSPVFNEDKYRALLDQLETSEVQFKDTYVSSMIFRLDAEYYKKIYSIIEQRIKSVSWSSLKDLDISLDCSAFYPSVANDYNFDAHGIPFLRVNEIVDGQIVISDNTAFLSKEIIDSYDTIKTTHNGDILIAKGGNTAGKVGFINAEYDVYATCRDVVILRTDTISKINASVLSLYLQSFFGRKLIERTISQTGQPHLTLPLLERIPIPLFSSDFQEKIRSCLDLFPSFHYKAQRVYDEAETLLLQELGLKGWYPSQESTVINTFSWIQKNGRLDAEYYQSKYREIKAKLDHYTQGTVSCGSLLKNAMTKLNTNTIYNYIELGDIGQYGEIRDCTRGSAENLPSRARQTVKTNDVIVSSIEGSLSSSALITEDYNDAICSTGFHVLHSSTINSETLLLLMKSWPIQALLKQGCSGTILTAILPDALKQINIPLIRKDIQQELATKVQKSFALRKKSKHLLAIAKSSVETAIEQNEETAIKLLEEEQNA